jgi:uncharacterized protein involved in exopolysaccharide biosynthesis
VSVRSEPRNRRARSAEPELDAEQEVDVGRYWSALQARWWLPIAGLVVGAALGYIAAVGGGEVYKAETTLYLGQPFSPTGNVSVPSISTNPTIVGQIARAENTLRRAAAASGIPVSKLRGNVSTGTVATTGRTRLTPGQNPLVELSVKGDRAGPVQRATDSIAKTIVSSVSSYPDQKVERLNQQITRDKRDLETINGQVERTQTQLNEVLNDKSLSSLEKLTLVTNFNSSIAISENRRSVVQQDLAEAEGLLSLAQNVERARIVDPAVATKTTARSTSNSTVVGALIGLLLGGIAALLWPAVATRRTP